MSLAHSSNKVDVLEILKRHFSSIHEQELETCVNGSIYCLMNVAKLRRRARRNGLREMLEQKLINT